LREASRLAAQRALITYRKEPPKPTWTRSVPYAPLNPKHARQVWCWGFAPVAPAHPQVSSLFAFPQGTTLHLMPPSTLPHIHPTPESDASRERSTNVNLPGGKQLWGFTWCKSDHVTRQTWEGLDLCSPPSGNAIKQGWRKAHTLRKGVMRDHNLLCQVMGDQSSTSYEPGHMSHSTAPA